MNKSHNKEQYKKYIAIPEICYKSSRVSSFILFAVIIIPTKASLERKGILMSQFQAVVHDWKEGKVSGTWNNWLHHILVLYSLTQFHSIYSINSGTSHIQVGLPSFVHQRKKSLQTSLGWAFFFLYFLLYIFFINSKRNLSM